jgi:3',5'-cyclic AMP phosphodiesterase CpdA
MPGIFFHTVDRRQFLKQSVAAVAALTLGKAQVTFAQSAQASTLHLALLADTHIPADRNDTYRGFKPWENLRRIVPEVVAARPAGVIVNGDAARLSGELPAYEVLKTLLAPIARQAPIYIGLGNHDDRDNFFQVIDTIPGDRQGVKDKHVLSVEHPVVRLLVLDSLLYVNKVAGLLGRAQRTWLSQLLDETDNRPTVLFIHHTLDDGDGDLLDVDRLFRLIRPHPKVKAIFYGHSHRYEVSERHGVHLINIPAVGYNFADDQPVGWLDARFNRNGVELTLRAFGGNLAGNGTTRTISWLL